MNGYLVHINSSTVNVGLFNDQETSKFVTEDFLPTAASEAKIIDPAEFGKEFSRLLGTHFGEKLPKLPLYFVLEPEVTELFLLTGNKNGGNDNEVLEKQIKERLVDEQPENLYGTYFKIAPFIYQFVGIKKAYLDSILETANILGLEIGGIFPLGLVLAKTNSDISSMFVIPNKKETTVIFSELTGVIFAEKFQQKVPLNELKDLYWKLSVYNSKEREIKFYDMEKLKEGGLEGGFEIVELAKRTLERNVDVLNSQANLLNILPVPKVAEKKKAPALVAAGTFSALLVSALIFQLTVGFGSLFPKNAPAQSQEVLAKQDEITTPAMETSKPEELKTPAKEIKRADIKIRVENGNGIPGSAGKLKVYLEGFGYNVAGVGNSDKSDYAKTTVKLPNDLANYKDLLVNDLKTNYSIEIVSVDTKPTDYDVLIIAGGN